MTNTNLLKIYFILGTAELRLKTSEVPDSVSDSDFPETICTDGNGVSLVANINTISFERNCVFPILLLKLGEFI